jgi:phosphate-selective porin OprO/OprP
MNGVLDGGSADANVNDGFDILGRVFIHPFQETSIELLQGFGIGVAASYGRRDGANNTATSTATAVYRSAGQQPFFSYGVGVSEADDLIRIAPQAYWYWGPLGLMAEWTRSTGNYRLAGTDISPDAEAWQLTGSWVVTGENKTYQGVVPRTSFNPAKEDTGPGAWELAARVGGFRIDDDVFDRGFASSASQAQEALEWGVGVNWYVNPFLKFSVNYNDTRFEAGAAGGDKSTEGVLLSRFQVAF